MKNWKPLSKEDENQVWDNFYRLFDFNPSIYDFPGIKTSLPEKKFSIEKYLVEGTALEKLENLALELFESISKTDERIYALDWQHQCFDFDPRRQMDRNEFGEWPVPILPNGDYFIFLTKNFQNVWFGHPWEETITLIGHDLIKQFEIQKATI